ncbi:zinc finger protein Xfin-like [Sinocyclocheilus anshuiensis]|uniref:zinc finger protein Xfin-like n=1 Tax=Sinocyclocheilus anshuiensis TaxID=1608454 RepID=UPI0007BA7947|nr:PREDICTED: zinc finger protein Xfin-like [Sinocyclocheilus anshuiensis]XP_016310970.1 PREDICTED: zinc finger protein Xfin-like [Sinocyclocheilus anshuiensis]
MSAQMQLSLLDEGGLDLHTGLTSAYSSKSSDGQWMAKNQEFEKEQEAIVTTQCEDNDVNAKVLQNKNRNGNKRVYECHVCLKRFGAPSKLKRHCLIHTNQRPFQCSICFRAFRECSHLKVHFRSHTNPSSPVTTARKRIFPVSKSSDRMCTLQLKKKSGYQCEICLKKFSFPSKLTRHLFVHFDVKAYTCTICRKSFKQAYYLHKHLKVHTEKRNGNSRLCSIPQKQGAKSPTPGAFECTNNCRLDGGNVCLPQILDSLETKKHEKPECRSKLNQNVQLIKSNSSTIEIKSSDTLKNAEVQLTTSSPVYLKHTHKGVNQCSICLKNFPYPSKLARHILSHTDVRPFKCHVCLKSFRYRWHLQCHVRIHNKKGQNIIAGHLEQDCTVSFSNAAKSEEQDVQIPSQDGAENSAKVHKDQNMVMDSQKTSGDCSDSGVYLQDSLLNKEGLDLHTGQSYAYPSKHSEGQWMEENQGSEHGQEASVTTQSKDKDVNAKVSQGKNFNGSKRVYDCPVCHKRFGAPSKLKRHCLIHTNQRPFQCSICCRAFRERSHLKVHFRSHNIHEKRRAPSLQSYRDNSVPCNRASKSNLKPSPKQPTAQDYTKSTDKEKSTVHQDQNMVTENMASQKISGDCNDSGVYLQDSLLNEGGWDRHTGQISAYSSKPSEGQWMEENQETEEEKEASVTTQNEDKDVNMKVLQRKNSNVNKRVYDCPVCHKRVGASSELKRHCLIHMNQRPFQCSICCRVFRERSHLKVHIRTHINPVKRTRSLHSYKDNSVPCNRTPKSRLKPSPKYLTVQNNASSTEKQQSTVHQDENMVTENVASQIISGDCSESDVYLQDSLLNKGGWDRHTGQSSAYSSKHSEGQWMEENQKTEEEQEASVTTQNEDKDVNAKVLQRKNSNVNKRVYDCPVCHKRFGAPSKLKRHCLIHMNQRPFQCSICCRAFRERSYLKVHFRSHNIHEKRRTPSLQSYRDNSVPCNQASKSRLKPSPKQPTAQDYTKSTDKEKSTVHQDENMVTENMASQKISGDCNDSGVYLQDSLLNEGGWDRHTGQISAYSSKPSEGQWMEENQETEEEKEASVKTQNEDKDVNTKVLQRKNSNVNKRVYDCPVCHKRFGAPSELKRHCLIHTNQRPFQCSICCRAFRERSHLKVHIRTHINPVKRTRSLHSYKDNSVPCNRTPKSRLKPSPKYLTVQNNASSTEKQQSTVHQDENMVTENVASQIISGDCGESDVYLQDSLLNKGGWDHHTGQSSAYSSKHSKGQWMEENQETEEEQEASVTTQNEDKDVNVKVLQRNNSNVNKRVYDCPVCHKRVGAPSELKRHCLIHTNQRPFQCSICCRAFRECSHLKVHMEMHNVPVKWRTPSLQSYRDNRVSCNQASKSKLKPSPKYLTADNDTTSTNKQKSTVQQDQNVLTEDASGGCSDSSVYLSKGTSPLENVENKVVFWCNNKSAWGLTHKTDILLDGKKASDIVPFGRVSDWPPKTDSSRHHCAPESRTEEKWAHHMDDIEDCVFVDSDTVVTQCVPDSYEPSSCQYQQKPDDPRLPEVVVELEDIEDPGECFIKPSHDLPFCPDCSQSFRTIRNLYAHNCTNRYPEGEMKKSHQCDICFKFFNAPSKLKRHYVTHTGQRPFQCTQCQKSFTQSHHLKTHMLSHR